MLKIYTREIKKMNNKETLDRIGKVKCNVMREMLEESFNKSNQKIKNKIGKMIEASEKKLKNDLNYKAKAIAAYVRCFMEDFHCKHLTNAQMKELNPIIRNAIYTFLVDEADGDYIGITSTASLNIAPYWEDCIYIKDNNPKIDFDDDEEDENKINK